MNDQAAEHEAIDTLLEMSRSLVIKDNQGNLQAIVRKPDGTVIFRTKLALTTET